MKLLIKDSDGYMQAVSGKVHPNLKAYTKGLQELAKIGHDALIVQEGSLVNPIAALNPAAGSSWEMSVSIHWFLPEKDGPAEMYELIVFTSERPTSPNSFSLELLRHDPHQPAIVHQIQEAICRRIECAIQESREDFPNYASSEGMHVLRSMNEILRILSFPPH